MAEASGHKQKSSRHGPHWYLSRSAIAIAVTVTLTGLIGVSLLSVALHQSELRDRQESLDAGADLLSLQLTSEFARYADAARSLAASLGSQQALIKADFDAITAPLKSDQLIGIEGVAFVVRSETDEVRATQSFWRRAGIDQLVLNPESNQPEHYFPIFERSIRRDTPSAQVAPDLSMYSELSIAFAESLAAQDVRLSRHFKAASPISIFGTDQVHNFALITPSFGLGVDGSTHQFKGWVAVGLRTHDIIENVLSKAYLRDFDSVKVTGLLPNGEPVLISHRQTGEGRTDGDLLARRTISAAQDSWQLEVSMPATWRFIEGGWPVMSAVVLITGSLATLLLGLLILVLAGSRSHALQLVQARTEALQRDIERREQVERDLKEAQRLSDEQRADLSAFAGFAAHDLKSPLTLMSGYLDLIKQGVSDASAQDQEELIDFCNRAARASKRMRSLIDSLLTFSRAREAQLLMEVVPLDPLVDELVAEHLERNSTRDNTPVITVNHPLPSVLADETMVRQVFDNLVGNSIKYVDEGDTPQLEISSRVVGDMAEITVADNGIGIPPDRRHAIFGNFVRGDRSPQYSGTGLGLAICKRLVERHGGSIRVEENPGKGSLFIFTLPIPSAEMPGRTG